MTFPRTIPVADLDRKAWSGVDTTGMSDADQTRFNRLKSAVDLYLDGSPPRAVQAAFGVSRAWLNKKLHNCVQRHPDGRLQGYRGLLKDALPRAYVREKAIAGGRDGFGAAGGFGKLLVDQPWISALIKAATKGKRGKNVTEAGLNVMALHREMVAGLKERGFTDADYPLHTTTKGYAPLLKHINSLILKGDADLRRAKYGDAIDPALDSRSGKVSWLTAHRPMSLVCYDEQVLPLIGTLVLELQDREIHVPMQRCSLCILVDEYTGAALAYFISMRRRIAASDVLKVFEALLTPWQPMELTVPGLRYGAGAGFPSGAVAGFVGARISFLKGDNDLVHLAKSVLQHAVDRTGMNLQYGELARPIARQAVEHVFALLQTRFLSRVPSTTGSGPGDPRVDDPVGKAVGMEIKMSDILQIVDIALATLNNTPRPSLYNATPLEELRREFSGPRGSVIPHWPKRLVEDPRFPSEILQMTIQGSIEDGRHPYVEHIDGTYTNDYLTDAWHLIGTKLTVHIHDDFRTLLCYNEDGSEFGTLWVTGRWRHSYHTKAIRQEIMAAKGKDDFEFGRDDDPVAMYKEHLARQAAKKVARKNPKISPEANRLARMMGPGNLGPHKTTAESLQRPRMPASAPAPIRTSAGARWRNAVKGNAP